MSFPPLEESNSAPSNLLAGFEGPLRGGGKRRKKRRKGEERKKGTKGMGDKHKINFPQK